MKRKEYERKMKALHGELVAMQEWVKAAGAKICIVFEGRDTAGKGARSSGSPSGWARGCSGSLLRPHPAAAEPHPRPAEDLEAVGDGPEVLPPLV
jgi:hypothetical protein